MRRVSTHATSYFQRLPSIRLIHRTNSTDNKVEQCGAIKQLIEEKRVASIRITPRSRATRGYLSARVNYTLPINVAATFCASKLH